MLTTAQQIEITKKEIEHKKLMHKMRMNLAALRASITAIRPATGHMAAAV